MLDKFTGKRATRVGFADAALGRKAIVAAHKARGAMADFAPDKRRDVLEHCVRRFGERQEELALALCIEAGKPIKDARGEVTRLIDTFRIAAGEATRIDGEMLESGDLAAHAGYRGMSSACRSAPARSSRRSTFRSTSSRTSRARARGRLPVRVEAGGEDPGRRADHRRSAGRNRPAARRVLDPAVFQRRRRCWSKTSASRC